MLRKLVTVILLIAATNSMAAVCDGGWWHHHHGYHHGYYPSTHVGSFAVAPAAVPSYYHAPVAVQSVGIQSVGVAPLAVHSYGYAPLVHSYGVLPAATHVTAPGVATQSVQSAGLASSGIGDIIAIIKLLQETRRPTPATGGGSDHSAELSQIKTRIAALEESIKKMQASVTDLQNRADSTVSPNALSQLQADVKKIKAKLNID